jgi:iron complex outermembrane recepter protein
MDPMYVVNAETAKIKGLEVELDWLVTDMDQISFSGTYTDSAYGRAIFPPNPMVGTTAPVNLEGKQMANTPKWTFTLGWEHTWTMQDGDSISARAFTRMSDQYYATCEIYIPGTLQERYRMSELYMNYYPSNSKWNAGVWVKNLENKAVTMRTMPIYRKFIGNPRTVGINFTIKY